MQMCFQSKKNLDGSISKHKARLIAKGFHQQAGLSFLDSFDPSKTNNNENVLTISLAIGWPTRQLDINNPLFSGTLRETIYMD